MNLSKLTQTPEHHISQKIQETGMKVTPTRIAVYQTLKTLSQPAEVAVIYKKVKQIISIDQVTVYRILEQFVHKRLVERVHFHEGKFRYEIASHHHHLICLRCGSVTPIDIPCQVVENKQIKAAYDFLVQKHTLEYFGLCKTCQD